MEKKYPKKIEEIEKEIKDKKIWDRTLERLSEAIEEVCKKGKKDTPPFLSHIQEEYCLSISTFLNNLKKFGEEKQKKQSLEKAMQPEKKKLPPIPEEKAF